MTYFENGNKARVEKNGLAFFVERDEGYRENLYVVRPASQVTGGQTLMEIQTSIKIDRQDQWDHRKLTPKQEIEVVDKLIFDLTRDIFSAFELAYEADLIRKDLNPNVENTVDVVDKIMDRIPPGSNTWVAASLSYRTPPVGTEGIDTGVN